MYRIKKLTTKDKKTMKKILKAIRFGSVMTAVALLTFSFFGAASADALITSSLSTGSSGSQVTELQTYLATNASIYPSGLITGYFGVLTEAAVQRFQAREGIVSSGTAATTGYGRVGPQTRARLNTLISLGGQGNWDTVPILSNLFITRATSTLTFSWNTNEPTQGQVFWDTATLRSDEASGPRQQPYVSGTQANDGIALGMSHNITVSGLQPNTLYNYLVRSIDSVGNMSMIWPSVVRTNQ